MFNVISTRPVGKGWEYARIRDGEWVPISRSEYRRDFEVYCKEMNDTKLGWECEFHKYLVATMGSDVPPRGNLERRIVLAERARRKDKSVA